MSDREKTQKGEELSSEKIIEETMREISEGLYGSEAEESGEADEKEEEGTDVLGDSVLPPDDSHTEDTEGEEPDGEEEEEESEGDRLIRLHRRKKMAIRAAAVAAGVLVLVYLGFALFFTKHFFFFTKINGTQFSAQSPKKVEEFMEGQVADYVLTLHEIDGDQEIIKGSQIDLEYVRGTQLEELVQEQNALLWITSLWNHPEIEAEVGVDYNKEKLSEVVSGLKCMQKDQQVPSENARPVFQETEFVIQEEVVGSQIDVEKFQEAVNAAISGFLPDMNMEEEGCYVLPQYTASSPEVEEAREAMNSYLGATVTYDFYPKTEVVDSEVISQWIAVNDKMEVTFDKGKVKEYIKGLADKYDTYGKTRTIVTGYGNQVEVSGGSYGWQLDQDAEYEALIADIKAAKAVEREPKYIRRAASHEGNDFGSSYVEIDLTNQHLWVYKNGSCVVETDIVTGNPNQGNGTPQGTYSLAYKTRNATLRGPKKEDGTYEWESPVSYWMPFNGDIGLHDASWQPTFGGDWYLAHGSHGCVNLPPSVAGKVYDNISAGTPVVCHY